MNNGHRPPRAVFFDVDFTLIHPGRAFQAAGYRDFCARHGVVVDERKFDEAVAGAAAMLDPGAGVYDSQVYVDYTRRIIEGMGGRGEAVDRIAREIFAEWALCHHFVLYDDVPDALRALRTTGVTIGLSGGKVNLSFGLFWPSATLAIPPTVKRPMVKHDRNRLYFLMVVLLLLAMAH